MKHLYFTLAILGTFAFTQASASASHAPSYPDRQLPNDVLVSSEADDLLLAQCYRSSRYYGSRYRSPAYYPGSFRGMGPYGYGAGYRGYGGYGRYSSRYGYGPRRGFGLYIGF